MALPSNVGFCEVSGRAMRALVDGTDPGREPDGIPIPDLTVTFRASVDMVSNKTATPPTLIFMSPIVGRLNTEGILIGPDGVEKILLVASNDPDLDPTGWTWTATIAAPTITSRAFSFVAPAGGSIDLATVAKVPAAPGTELVQWQAAVTATATSAGAAENSAQAAAYILSQMNARLAAQKYAAGLYYATPGAGSPVGRPNGFLTMVPFKVETEHTFTGIGIEVITAGNAGSTIRLGIYRDDQGKPGDLAVDVGSVDTASTGIKMITGATIALAPGMYYLAAGVQGAATTTPAVRGFSPGQILPGASLAAAGGSFQHAAGWQIGNGGQGALPATAAGATPADTTILVALLG